MALCVPSDPMSWLVTVAVLGFDLERGRRLAHDHPPPPLHPPSQPSPPSPPPVSPPHQGCNYVEGGRSCDEDYKNSCDEQGEDGKWSRSCDLHPSTGCDDWAGCKYPPPPPLAPAPPGGYSPPPESLEEERPLWPMIVFWSMLGVAVLILLICCCVARQHRSVKAGTSGRGRLNYFFCCCLQCCWGTRWRTDDKNVHVQRDPPMLSRESFEERDERMAEEIRRGEVVAAAVMPALSLALK